MSDSPLRHSPDAVQLRGWSVLAVGALGLAGLLALILALTRSPGVGPLLPWSSDFFYRALVTHVVLSFQIWFLAMLAVQCLLVTPTVRLGRPALALGALAVVVLVIPALADQGHPLLNNYVPLLIHPVFIGALMAMAVAVAVVALSALPGLASPDPARFGTGAAALSYLSALVCFALAARGLPTGIDTEILAERTVWGGGHVLQVVNTLMLMVAWQHLSCRVWGEGPLSPPLARAVFAVMAMAAVAAPAVYALADPDSLAHRVMFTRMLWLALPLPPALFGAGLAAMMVRRGIDRKDPVCLSLLLSLLVFALGGAAGFFLGVGDTRTPSHYHAVIGGVNLGLMGLFPALILPTLGRMAAPASRAAWPFLLYGGGQMLHALGFYAAGMAGVPRKTMGAEQILNTPAKLISMGLVGLGGTVAVLGGVLFLWDMTKRLLGPATLPPQGPMLSQDWSQTPTQRRLAGLVVGAGALMVAVWLGRMPPLAVVHPGTLDQTAFAAQQAAMISAGDTGRRLGDVPVVRAGPGDVYLSFRRWSIEPALVLAPGQTYRLHVMALDGQHSAAINGKEVLLEPGQEQVMEITTPVSGTVPVQCGEFCGNGHSRMTGSIDVLAVPQPGSSSVSQ